jgi:hypothetical protein
MRTVLSTLVVAAMCGSASAKTAQSLGAPAGDPKRGERVYMEQLCYTCHGTLGQGGERGAHRDWRSAADARRARAAEHLVLLGHRPQPPRPRNAVAHRQRPLLILDDLPHLGGKPRGADGCRVEADGGRLLVALVRRGRASRSCVEVVRRRKVHATAEIAHGRAERFCELHHELEPLRRAHRLRPLRCFSETCGAGCSRGGPCPLPLWRQRRRSAAITGTGKKASPVAAK